MKYVVVSQDREIFKTFKEALGYDPMKISSALASKTVLGDKDSTFDFVVIDNDLKGIQDVLKLLKKRKILFYLIGEVFEKPVTIEQIKRVIVSKVEVKESSKEETKKEKVNTAKKKPTDSNIEITNVKEISNTVIEKVKNEEKIQEEKKTVNEVIDDNLSNLLDDIVNYETDHNELLSDLDNIIGGVPVKNNEVKQEQKSQGLENLSISESEPSRPKNNENIIRRILKKQKMDIEQVIIKAEEDEEQDLADTNKGFAFSNFIGKGIKAMLTAKEEKEEIIVVPNSRKKTKVISQQIIGIRRVKGGVGATSTALHLAQAFTAQGIKTCIIDVNFVDGGSDLSYYMDLPQVPHWGNFLRNPDGRTSFQESLVEFNGISVLQVPPAMNLIDDSLLIPEAVIKAMNYARKQFSMVIIDLPNEINPIIREVIDSFLTTTILVTNGHISELNRIEKLNDLDNPIIALNGSGIKSLSRFKDYLDGVEQFVTIPEDPELYRTLEKKRLRSINTPYGAAINNLALKIFEI